MKTLTNNYKSSSLINPFFTNNSVIQQNYQKLKSIKPHLVQQNRTHYDNYQNTQKPPHRTLRTFSNDDRIQSIKNNNPFANKFKLEELVETSKRKYSQTNSNPSYSTSLNSYISKSNNHEILQKKMNSKRQQQEINYVNTYGLDSLRHDSNHKQNFKNFYTQNPQKSSLTGPNQRKSKRISQQAEQYKIDQIIRSIPQKISEQQLKLSSGQIHKKNRKKSITKNSNKLSIEYIKTDLIIQQTQSQLEVKNSNNTPDQFKSYDYMSENTSKPKILSSRNQFMQSRKSIIQQKIFIDGEIYWLKNMNERSRKKYSANIEYYNTYYL